MKRINSAGHRASDPQWRNSFRFTAQLSNSGQRVPQDVADEFDNIVREFVDRLRVLFPAADDCRNPRRMLSPRRRNLAHLLEQSPSQHLPRSDVSFREQRHTLSEHRCQHSQTNDAAVGARNQGGIAARSASVPRSARGKQIWRSTTSWTNRSRQAVWERFSVQE
jgi:hypothetical protein